MALKLWEGLYFLLSTLARVMSVESSSGFYGSLMESTYERHTCSSGKCPSVSQAYVNFINIIYYTSKTSSHSEILTDIS